MLLAWEHAVQYVDGDAIPPPPGAINDQFHRWILTVHSETLFKRPLGKRFTGMLLAEF